ncbi:MAG TPA: GntR family transcriptional regulator [Kofleriaceae bacterium]
MSRGVEEQLRRYVITGNLPAGTRVNEVQLAKTLDVSRTPLREALTRLAGEAFLEARPHHGFYVRPLTVAEALELYPIRAKLDPWALELAGVPSRAVIDRLEARNALLLDAAASSERVIELDDEWHLELVAGCPNQVLIALIKQMMWRTRRYEHAYFRATKNVSTAYTEHKKLLAALRRKDLAGACKRLETNMTSAIPELVRWLEGRT